MKLSQPDRNAFLAVTLILAGTAPTFAQDAPVFRPLVPIAPPGRVVVAPAGRPVPGEVAVRPPGGLLGTFYPESTVNIMGSGEVRGGYAPLDMYGPNTLSLVGPLSVYRVKSAPVLTYTRGYDGALYPSAGISLSYPNFPAASPVIYPTRANDFYAFPRSGVPPWWVDASHWIDQN